MKVAIAGTNGLAYWIAHHIENEGQNQFIMLSRAAKPHLTARGWQVVVVDYRNQENLIFSLAGIDVVVSLVVGESQLALIDAAVHTGVERFIPAEFDGPLARRSANDPLDQGQQVALSHLQQHESRGMAYTVFTCGILYERFGPGGMRSANLGHNLGANGEGDYLVNIRSMRSRIPHDPSGIPATISMTAAEDVGRFVAAALNLPQLPTELHMRGDRMNVSELVRVAEIFRGATFERAEHNADTLQSAFMLARYSQDRAEMVRVQMLIATGQGRFDVEDTNLNVVVDVSPISFQDWLRTAWEGHLP